MSPPSSKSPDPSQIVHTVVTQYVDQPMGYYVPGVESPRNQVWFMGRRIWYPQTSWLLFSLVISFLSFFFIPLLPAFIGVLIAIYCVKNGDIRGYIVIIVNLLIGYVSTFF